MFLFHALLGDVAEATFDDGRPVSQTVINERK